LISAFKVQREQGPIVVPAHVLTRLNLRPQRWT